MKFIVEKSVLLKEIVIAQEIISVKNAMSILSNILLNVNDGFLTIKATDLKVSFETKIPVHEIQEGTTTVFCEKFLNILRSLPDKEIEFELKDTGKFHIKPVGTTIDFNLKSVSGDKFPETKDTSEFPYFELPQAEVLEMINQTIFAVSDDETRYFMNGVFLENKNDKLIMVATDGRRLSYIEKPLNGAEIPPFQGVIIPPKALNLIKKLASGEGNMALSLTEKQIFVNFDNQKIASNLIEGQFPNYSRVIPEVQENTVVMKKEDFMEGLKRVSILAEQKSKRIYLSLTQGNLLLNSEESEMGSSKEEIPCQYEGPTVTMALNYGFLMDPLRVIHSQNITLQFTDPKKAITLGTDPKADYFHIVMPMQLD